MGKVVHLKKVVSKKSEVIGQFKAKSDDMMRAMRENGVNGFAMIMFTRDGDGASVWYDGYSIDPLDTFMMPYLLMEKIRGG